KKDDIRSPLLLMDVALTHRALDACRGLTLPMNQFRTNRIVPISRRRREATNGLVESEGEEVRGVALGPPNAGLPRRWLRTWADAETRKNLRSRVTGVRHDRGRRTHPQRPVDVRDAPAK